MDRATAFQRFCTQRYNACRRVIEWRFTFEQWLEWWGADLGRRGRGHDELQMQRIGDAGAYEPGNVRKGYPMDNAKTNAKNVRRDASLAAKAQLERARDESAPTPDRERYFDEMSDDEREIDRMLRCRTRTFFTHV